MHRVFVLAAMIASLLAPSAAASTIYSNFGPGNSYNCCAGYAVGGSAGMFGQQTNAVEFHSGFNAYVDQIDFAIGHVDGANGAIVSLWTESAGLPGTMLGSWTISLPAYFAPNGVTSITGISGINLSNGADYFLVAGPLNIADDSAALWSLNDIGATGFVPTDFGSGWDLVGSIEVDEPAFAIFGSGGSVPEPASLALMIGGIAGATRLRRRTIRK